MRVYILDDEPLLRAGLRQTLSCDPALVVVGEAATAREAFRDPKLLTSDVVITDVGLPGMDGVAATRELKRRSPRVAVVVFTVYDRVRDLLDLFAAGASAYVVKTDPIEALLAALRAVTRGERFVSPSLAPLLEPRSQDAIEGLVDALGPLSVREREIFQLMVAGSSIVETAREYCISRKTVETHVYRLYRKLGCHNAGDLIRFAAEHGLLRLGPSRSRRSSVSLAHQELVHSADH
jgi:DNA-binding NarL/FixJ family response regulator